MSINEGETRSYAESFRDHELALVDTTPADHDEVVAIPEALLARGFALVTGGTDNHLLLVDMTPKGVAGKPYAQALERAGIVCNYNSIPFDPRKPFDPSGLRIGTPAITSRGMGAAEMKGLAAWMDEIVAAPGDDRAIEHAGRLAQCRLDLGQFHSIAQHLDLTIAAAERVCAHWRAAALIASAVLASGSWRLASISRR